VSIGLCVPETCQYNAQKSDFAPRAIEENLFSLPIITERSTQNYQLYRIP
jgi:hypothetical protein